MPTRLYLTILVLIYLHNLGAANYDYNYDGEDNGGGYYSSSAFSASESLKVVPCDDSVILVTDAKVSCDSPYTFYYGNGANRNSPVCDYGDKATFAVDFTVQDDIDQVSDLYMTMAVYDPLENLLASTQPQFLCSKYVGYDCMAAGVYNFTAKVRFDVFDANITNFQPELKIAFSTAADHGTNLGAVNTDCAEWEDPSQAYVDWNQQTKTSMAKRYLIEYGIILGAGGCIVALLLFIRKQAGDYVDESYFLDEGGRNVSLLD